MPFTHQLATHALADPHRPALILVETGQVTTFAELEARSNQVAHLLERCGLTVGDHIAILAPNGRPFLEVAWAAQKSGLYYTALNSHLQQAEVQHILDDSGAAVLFVDHTLADVAARLDRSRLRLVAVIGGQPDGLADTEDYDTLLADQPTGPTAHPVEGREMLYSSGTTGVPKGVRKDLSPTELGDPAAVPVALAIGIEALGFSANARFLNPAPLYHSAPLVYSMSTQRNGGTVVLMERFDATTALAAIEQYRITHAQFVPTMFSRMLRLPDPVRSAVDCSSLQVVLHAAAPCPVPVKQAMLDWWGPIIHEYYAGTEDIGSTFITAGEWITHPGSVGRPSVETHILDDDGVELPTGTAGTIWFVPARSFEYHNDPDKTESITNDRGWRTLGDVGYLDDDGYLYLTDRASDMIVAGGVNVYPRETEHLLLTHPAVADAAVFGVPDDDLGERVHAVVQLDRQHATAGQPTAEELSAEELMAWCRERLASFKCPRSVEFVDELPRDPSGKLFKRLLRDQHWSGRTSQIV